MPAIANVVANDAEATPVAHTFEPAKTTADFALWEDRDAGIYVGNKKLTVRIDRPAGNGNVGNRNLKLHWKLEMPRLEALGNSSSGITPAPTVAYRCVAEVIWTLPERSSLQERKNLRGLLAAMVSGSGSASAVALTVDTLSVPY